MTRLIDAELLTSKISFAGFPHIDRNNRIDKSWVYELINSCPTVDERPHGKWIKVLKPYGGFGDQVLMIECSKCHTELVYHGKEPKYCLECGADMREADHEQ